MKSGSSPTRRGSRDDHDSPLQQLDDKQPPKFAERPPTFELGAGGQLKDSEVACTNISRPDLPDQNVASLSEDDDDDDDVTTITMRMPPFQQEQNAFVYHDYSTATLSHDLTSGGRSSPTSSLRVQKLPAKLNAMLSNPEFTHIISWMPHGRAWKVHDSHFFLEKVIPRFFEYNNYNSFIRLVNAWGFRRVLKGPDRNSYYHELFLRGMPHLHARMHRLTSTEKKAPVNPTTEPDFYRMSDVGSLPPPSVPSFRQFSNLSMNEREHFNRRYVVTEAQRNQFLLKGPNDAAAIAAEAAELNFLPSLARSGDPHASLMRSFGLADPSSISPLADLIQSSRLDDAANSRRYLLAGSTCSTVEDTLDSSVLSDIAAIRSRQAAMAIEKDQIDREIELLREHERQLQLALGTSNLSHNSGGPNSVLGLPPMVNISIPRQGTVSLDILSTAAINSVSDQSAASDYVRYGLSSDTASTSGPTHSAPSSSYLRRLGG